MPCLGRKPHAAGGNGGRGEEKTDRARGNEGKQRGSEMKEEQRFAPALERICGRAAEQGNTVSEAQVEEILTDAGFPLEEAQLALVHEYLKGKKIGIGEPVDPFDYLTQEETSYLDSYLEALAALPEATEGEKEAVTLSAMAGDGGAKRRLIEIFLPQVTEIAKLYAGQGVFLEDLIGEGNMALTMAAEMLDTAANVQEAHGTLASMIMEAMETFIAQNAAEGKTGEKLAGRANDVLEKAKELAEELGRKVTVEELAEETGLSAERIREAVRITADNIDYLDTKDIHG